MSEDKKCLCEYIEVFMKHGLSKEKAVVEATKLFWGHEIFADRSEYVSNWIKGCMDKHGPSGDDTMTQEQCVAAAHDAWRNKSENTNMSGKDKESEEYSEKTELESITYKVEKRGDKWCVVHCTGPDAGKVIACHETEEAANAQHRAIQANK